jgi:adenine-specific DNA-methyltransferase
MSKFNELVTKLREIFQIDRPELDFGVYRILNARADEINDYLTNRLREQVEAALTSGAVANVEAQQRELDETIKALTSAGVDPNSAPKVKELRAAITAASSGASEHENAVFSHLLAFFSRYYDKGDFISQRRYKGDTYAIPYAGEEVVLHWANKDQYYTKSGEAFSNYGFKLDDGRSVQFQLIAADTAKDNRKDNDKDRRFALADARTVTKLDDEGEPYEEEIVPLAEEGGDLVIRFEYRAFPAKTKQESLVDDAVQAVLADEAVKTRWLSLTTRAPTNNNPQRTLLEKHLTTYTQKNTVDYFIHKDLGTFLRRELDFYIKNEVMNLDDVQDAKSFAAIEVNLRMIQCLRGIAQDLIIFLASIEDFQKKLWLKKKFVVAAHYCVTLDRVPEALYELIAANPAQWAQWHDLGMRDSASSGTAADLKVQPFLMVDTALFDGAFRADLLKAIPDLDASMDGLLVHGDNFQALTLLTERYREKVKYIYIDPPYNTNSTPILYKNGFKNSSWATLMHNRLSRSMAVLNEDGVVTVAIDDSEMANLSAIMREIGEGYRLTRVPIIHNPKGSITKDFNRVHEYALFLTKDDSKTHIRRGLELNDTPRKMRRWGENSRRVDRRPSFYPIIVREDKIVDVGIVPPDDFSPLGRNVQRNDGSIEIWPIDQDGVERRWNFGLESIRENLDRVTIRELDGTLDLFVTHEKTVPKTVWSGGDFDAGNHGNTLLTNILGSKLFDFPKSINQVKKSIDICSEPQAGSLVMDYFGGSGTTAHATIALNREQGANRRYALVEQGPYFDTVVKPRTQKIVYSAEWSEGKPTAPETGISHAFKVLKIESYEDTLNNLTLKRDSGQQGLLDRMGPGARDEYVIRYMLDVEARGSSLSVEDFSKPFNYELDIAVDSAGASERTKIDLLETFNYLIGLTVKTIDIQIARGFATVEGMLPDGKRTLILWRDCEKLDYEALIKLCDRLAINPGDKEYDVVYINGDHNLPTKLQASEAEGGGEKELTIRQIEPEFLSRMFDVADA